MHIAVFVPEHAVIESITPAYRAFKTANDFLHAFGKKSKFTVEYVGLEHSIYTNDGEYSIRTHRLLQDLNKTDLLILPAIYGDVQKALDANQEAIPFIQQLFYRGSSLASLCIGAFLMAETGLVDSKKCSTHWAYYNEFKERYPEVEIVDGAVITDEGNIYSSGGANSLWNLILYLIEKFTSREIAILLSKYFAIDIDRNNQSAFMIFQGQKDHHDKEIIETQLYIEKEYQEKITMDQLAERCCLGRRTFERRFKLATNNSPLEYLQRVRIEAAKRSFEASLKNVSEVMYEVGYTDTKAFRDVFKKITGLTPIDYRTKFSKQIAIENEVANFH